MRLISTTTHELREFYEEETTPAYAILSHTWGDKEVSLAEWRMYVVSRSSPWEHLIIHFSQDSRMHHVGSKELRLKPLQEVAFCRISKQRGYLWVWVDTCCIDKLSSAQLSEAINSMLTWCQNAQSCFAYLSDVCDEKYEWIEESIDEYFSSPSGMVSPAAKLQRFQSCGFMSSRWFRRGWTLQELLAPSEMGFYDLNWQYIAKRGQLAKFIRNITNVPEYALGYQVSLRVYRSSLAF